MDKHNSEFINEFDYLISQGWWFSVTPKNNKWSCTIFRLKPSGTWEAQESKQFKTILKGMVWVETYLTSKVDNG